MPKAYVFTRYGGPETEAFVDVDRPSPGPGLLLVAVRAAGVNPVDWKQRNGFRRPGERDERIFPAVFGNEVSGVVEEIGDGVEGFAVGDEVFGSASAGGYAEYTLVPAAVAAHKPAELPHTVAATLPVAAATAYDGVRQLGLPPGATLLVTGAGGGVGAAAVQIARAFGLRAVGVASQGKKDFVESLGAVHVASVPGWAERVRAAAPDGVDGVYDLVGGELLAESAELLTDRTRLITAGAAEEDVRRLGGARVTRARTAAVLEAVARLVIDGDLDPHITGTFPLDRAGDALRTVEEGHARGKTVIEVAQ
ncbi:quinone oxidoreductase family protein [Streptomyces pseudovenezuelae]|uniref:quinone oxidoreductase family protein n=1 Tax=Streptomyces pseudovenezuelae TaxID=67350 RepID=UPI002E818E72|nr:NADP-dependent oxidoreductase [Streptomyces pseudovenezuelae]WUA92986.1 NADP-dependent oxidoreductase [Streptomyces pseudovenezuelae]